MSNLVEDVVCEVLSALYWSDFTPDRRSLLACARVATTWSYSAQQLLYRHVAIRDSRDLRSFTFGSNPGTSKGRSLGNAVRVLDIVVGGEITFTTLSDVLKHCPHLFEIRLTLGNGCATLDDDLALRASIPEKFRVFQLYLTANVDRILIDQLFQLFQPTEFATIVSDHYNLSISLDQDQFNVFDLGELSLEWPLQINHETLSPSVLRLWELPLKEEYEIILSLFGPHLRSLTMPKSRCAWAPQAHECLQSCPLLEQLCLLESRVKGRWYREYLVEFAYYLEDWLAWAKTRDRILYHDTMTKPFRKVVCYGADSHADEYVTTNSRQIVRDPRKQVTALTGRNSDSHTIFNSVIIINRKPVEAV